MTLYNALTIQSGVTKQIHSSDTLNVGNGIDTDSAVALTIGPSVATSITLGKTGVATTVANLTTGVVHAGSGGLLTSSQIVVGTDVTGGTDTQILQTVGSTPTWVTFSQDATVADSGVVTVVSAHGNFAVGVGGTSTLTIDGAGNFTTGTGTNTINGNITTGNNPNFDFSGSTGTFKTSSGTTTIAGATTFTASGTALTVNNNATVTGSLTAGSVLTSTVDTASAGTLSIGTSTATAITLGKTGVTTTSAGPLTSTGLLTASNAFTVTTGAVTLSALTASGVLQLSTSNVVQSTVGTTAQLLVAQSSGPATWNTLSGDGYINASGLLTITQAAGNFEVKGNLTVDGTETIIGTSTFQSPVMFDNNVTIIDGYSLLTDSISSTGIGAGVLNVNGQNGFNLQVAGSTVIDGYSSSIVYIPSGVTLQALPGGNIIATSSSGTTDLTVAVTATGFTAGQLGYVSAAGTLSKALATALNTAMVFGVAPTSAPTTTSYVAGQMLMALDAGTYNPGDRLYVSATNAGQVTNSVSGYVATNVVAPVGIYFDSTATVVSGATKQALLQILTPVVL